MDAIRIDPEFQKKIPPLTDEEFAQLRENILTDGEVYEPLILWNGIIIDGHNRWKIILEHPEIAYHTHDMDFPNKWAAFEWMYKKQLGRRNLTKQQRTALIGETYLSRKKSIGAPLENANAKKQFPQNEGIDSSRNETAEVIAKELGIGRATVERAAKYAQGIETLRTISEEAADKMLRGYSGIQNQAVMSFPMLEPDDLQKVSDAILAGEDLPEIATGKKPSPKAAVQTEQVAERHETISPATQDDPPKKAGEEHQRKLNLDPEIERINAEARDLESIHEYTLDDMLTEMREISRTLTSQIEHVLTIRSYILSEPIARAEVSDFLDESIASLDALKSLVAPFDP